MLVPNDIFITSGSLRLSSLIGKRGALRFWGLGGGRNLDCLFLAHRLVLYCCISLMWFSIAGLIVKYGRLDSPMTGGPPSGTRDLHFLTALAGTISPVVASTCRAARAIFRTLPRSARGSTPVLSYLASSAGGMGLLEKASKSRANSRNVTWPGASIHCSSFSHPIRLNLNRSGHFYCDTVGSRKVVVGGSFRGRGPTS